MTENKLGRPRVLPEGKNAQTEANKRWAEKNREYKKYLSYRTMARSFIKKLATDEDIEELKQLISERETAKDI